MTEKKLSTLVINQVESIDVYNLLKTQGKINQDELYLISGEPDTITGVKGNKETTYRTGNVNLTPADIGALPDDTEIPVVPTIISAFDNDVGYLTQHQSLTDYPKKTELANVATSGDYTDLINTPTIPSTEGLATETYVQSKIAEVVNSAPGTLDTLNELAQALGNDPNFATTMATELGKKANTANLATVATSGDYNDLINKPTIPSVEGLASEAYVNEKVAAIKVPSLDGYAKTADLATVATSGSYNDLSDTPTIPSVGNGTLTIQKNGTSAGTFTANATADKTINIIVPTKVSELTDDVVKGKYLSLTGGTMTGNININNKTITNLKTPTADTEAANKKYVDDQIAANDHIVNKFTFTATEGQSTFTIPFDFEDSSALTVYYNGVMMKETDNYTISGKTITLAGFTAEADDYITVMGIEGAAAIDFGQEATDAITQMNTAKSETITAINNIKSQASTEINTVKSNAITEINNLVDTLPSDTTSLMFLNKTNTMTANGKITMDSSYTPGADGDIATKKYVDNSTPATFTASKAGTVPASGGGTTKYLRADGTWTTIDKTPVIGTDTNYAIYIGTTAPASGTTPLLWIDTTSSTGFLKYRSSNTSAWTAVPVAWT